MMGSYADRTVHAVYSPTRYLPQKVRVLIDHFAAQSASVPTRSA
jgi:DNA-binding transcriptional LysR family regulator